MSKRNPFTKRNPLKEWRPIKKVGKPIKKVWQPKPQWKPTGRHFSLYEKYPLTRIVEPNDETTELSPSASSSSKVTMISRFSDYKRCDPQSSSKGISGSTNCSMVSGFSRNASHHEGNMMRISPETLKELQDESVSE
nr:hypothetical protein [Tanacetum cinerariifolium]